MVVCIGEGVKTGKYKNSLQKGKSPSEAGMENIRDQYAKGK